MCAIGKTSLIGGFSSSLSQIPRNHTRKFFNTRFCPAHPCRTRRESLQSGSVRSSKDPEWIYRSTNPYSYHIHLSFWWKSIRKTLFSIIPHLIRLLKPELLQKPASFPQFVGLSAILLQNFVISSLFAARKSWYNTILGDDTAWKKPM